MLWLAIPPVLKPIVVPGLGSSLLTLPDPLPTTPAALASCWGPIVGNCLVPRPAKTASSKAIGSSRLRLNLPCLVGMCRDPPDPLDRGTSGSLAPGLPPIDTCEREGDGLSLGKLKDDGVSVSLLENADDLWLGVPKEILANESMFRVEGWDGVAGNFRPPPRRQAGFGGYPPLPGGEESFGKRGCFRCLSKGLGVRNLESL